MAAMLLADWQAPVRGGEPVPPAGARRSTIPLAMKPVTRAGREPRDVAYEPIAIASRASAPVRLVGATGWAVAQTLGGRCAQKKTRSTQQRFGSLSRTPTRKPALSAPFPQWQLR